MTTLMTSFGSLRFSDTAEPGDPKAVAAKEHGRIIKLTTFDGKTTSLALGRKPEEKIVKAPAVDATKTGPAALLESAGAARKDPASPSPATSEGPAKTIEPSTETIPAGPVYVSISYPDTTAPATALMQKRAVSISDYLFTSLPQKTEEMFEAAIPTPSPSPTPTP